MTVCGIIAEYNPFHLGHQFHIRETKKRLGEDCPIVCVMSGNFVQRGAPAVFSKASRAHAALLAGADLVLELPLVWAMAAADRFAAGAVSLLAQTGVVTHLSFGSEWDDLDLLWTLAKGLERPEMEAAIVANLQSGISYPAARQMAAEQVLGEETASYLRRPNFLLAVSYLRAIHRLAPEITPVAIRRQGAGHDASAPQSGLASASFVRALLEKGDWDGAMSYLPIKAQGVFAAERGEGRGPAFMEHGERAILARLRAMGAPGFAALPEAGGGLGNRLYDAVKSQSTVPEIIDAAKTKRYTHAHLRRQVLRGYLGVTKDEWLPNPPYLRVLGATEQGRALLSVMRNTARLPVLTKPAHGKKLAQPARAQLELEAKAGDLYALLCPRIGPPGEEWRQGPVLV